MNRNKKIPKLMAMMLSIIMVIGMVPVSIGAETSSFSLGVSGEISTYEELLVGTSELDSTDTVSSTVYRMEEMDGADSSFEGCGTMDEPFLIKTGADLFKLAELVNLGNSFSGKYFRLENDISLSAYGEGYNDGKGWQPIYLFKGIFDGAGHKIKDLYINRSEDNYVGLFGRIDGGTVKNLTVEDGTVTGSECTGGIVGFFVDGWVENCSFSGSVSGGGTIGGIVGALIDSKLKDCVNNGSVSGLVYTGGIAGSARNSSEEGSIENCVNNGEVMGSIAFSGGIAGSLTNILADYCVNTGTVQGGTAMNTGGIAGGVIDGIIQNSVNTGTMQGGTGINTGGVVGSVESEYNEAIIQNSVNSGTVSGNGNNIGGVAGKVYKGIIQNSVNYADISADANNIGGVAGFVEEGSMVKNCLTTGNILGNVTEIERGGISGVVGHLYSRNYSHRNTITGCVALAHSVIKLGDMGSVARIATMEQSDMAYNNFAWCGMELWYDKELILEEEYTIGDGEDVDLETLPTLWTNGDLAEDWQGAGVWTLVEKKLPVLTGLPHQNDKFPSHIPMAIVDPISKTFTAAIVGYGVQTAQQFTIQNNSLGTITGLNVSLTEGSPFELSTTLSDTTITSGNTATVSVRPKTGLSVGTYTDTLHITGDNGISLTASLFFTVNNSSGGNSGNGGNPSNGGGSSNRVNDTSPVTITPEQKLDQPVTITIPVTATSGTKGFAIISIPDKIITDAITKAQSDRKGQGKVTNDITVELNFTMPPSATSCTITLTRNSLNCLVKEGVVGLEISGSPVTISFDKKALAEILKQSTGDVTITIKLIQNISDEAKKLIATRPVYDISVSYAKDGKPIVVATFNGGIATILIPYKPTENEVTNYLYAVYIDAKGKATRIEGSAYDTNAGAILFSIGHFSVYGVGYTAPSAKFTDINNHWGQESIDYVVGRGLLSGTSETTFAPNTAMTRGMLVTALGRLAGVDTNSYTTNSFTDVKADSPFCPYIEWAYQKDIVQGIGNSQFAPDRAITREEIAVIFANYAQVNGYPLPITREATTYADASSIGNAYKTAVTAIQQAGIMIGGENNRFNPKISATRAEVSSMLQRYIKLTISPATAQEK